MGIAVLEMHLLDWHARSIKQKSSRPPPKHNCVLLNVSLASRDDKHPETDWILMDVMTADHVLVMYDPLPSRNQAQKEDLLIKLTAFLNNMLDSNCLD